MANYGAVDSLADVDELDIAADSTDPDFAPDPWYRNRVLLALWALAVALVLTLIIYGLVELSRGGEIRPAQDRRRHQDLPGGRVRRGKRTDRPDAVGPHRQVNRVTSKRVAEAALSEGHGVDRGLELEPAYVGNAYLATDKPRLPSTLRDARELFTASAVAREAFGDEVVDHYTNAADVELHAFEGAVTDWERVRGFERL